MTRNFYNLLRIYRFFGVSEFVPKMEYWNGGTMEYWESKADDGLILKTDPRHPYKI